MMSSNTTVLATLSMPQNITVARITIVTHGNFESLKYFVDGNLEKILLLRFTYSYVSAWGKYEDESFMIKSLPNSQNYIPQK